MRYAVVRCIGLAAAGIAALFVGAPVAAATFAGRNGVLLWAATTPRYGVVAGSLRSPPVARPADCTDGPLTLWSLRSDGTHSVRLGAGDQGVFSPNGGKLAIRYMGDPCYGYPYPNLPPADPSAGLFLSRPDGSDRRRVAGDELGGWLASGRLLTWQHSGRQQRLLDAVSKRTVMTIAANPGGTGISCSGRVADATAMGHGAALDVFTRKAIRGARGVSIAVVRRRVATGPGIGNPAWSPDGRLVLFERADKIARSGSWIVSSLWVVGADGGGLRRLLAPANSVNPAGAWSPDGRRILFQRYPQRGTFHQLVVNANGSGAHPVNNDSIPGIWSPDSRSIAFVGGNQGYGIALVDAVTGAQTSVFNLSWNVLGLFDWQALPGGHSVRCADHSPAAIP